jgi:hypothetical protein
MDETHRAFIFFVSRPEHERRARALSGGWRRVRMPRDRLRSAPVVRNAACRAAYRHVGDGAWPTGGRTLRQDPLDSRAAGSGVVEGRGWEGR